MSGSVAPGRWALSVAKPHARNRTRAERRPTRQGCRTIRSANAEGGARRRRTRRRDRARPGDARDRDGTGMPERADRPLAAQRTRVAPQGRTAGPRSADTPARAGRHAAAERPVRAGPARQKQSRAGTPARAGRHLAAGRPVRGAAGAGGGAVDPAETPIEAGPQARAGPQAAGARTTAELPGGRRSDGVRTEHRSLLEHWRWRHGRLRSCRGRRSDGVRTELRSLLEHWRWRAVMATLVEVMEGRPRRNARRRPVRARQVAPGAAPARPARRRRVGRVRSRDRTESPIANRRDPARCAANFRRRSSSSDSSSSVRRPGVPQMRYRHHAQGA